MKDLLQETPHSLFNPIFNNKLQNHKQDQHIHESQPQKGNNKTKTSNREIDISCLKEQICRAQLSGSAFNILFAIFKYLTDGNPQEKHQYLKQYITSFFIKQLKMNPQSEYFCVRIDAGINRNPLIIYDKTYLLYGIDLMMNNNLEKMLNKFKLKLNRVDASHCLVEFDTLEKGWQFIKSYHSRHNKSDIIHWRQNPDIICRDWIKLISYTQLIFQRQIWIRNFTHADQQEIHCRKGIPMNAEEYQKVKKQLYIHLKLDHDISSVLLDIKRQYDIKDLNNEYQIQKLHKNEIKRNIELKKEYRYQDYVNLRQKRLSRPDFSKNGNKYDYESNNAPFKNKVIQDHDRSHTDVRLTTDCGKNSKRDDRRLIKEHDYQKVKPFEVNHNKKSIMKSSYDFDSAEIMTTNKTKQPFVKVQQQYSSLSSFYKQFDKCHINSQISEIAQHSNHMISNITNINKLHLESHILSGFSSFNLTSNHTTTVPNNESLWNLQPSQIELHHIKEQQDVRIKANEDDYDGEDQISKIIQTEEIKAKEKLNFDVQRSKLDPKLGGQSENKRLKKKKVYKRAGQNKNE